jgi:hypothetical protein
MSEFPVPNEYAISGGTEEIVARRGRSYASVCVAQCADGLYRQSTELLYCYGGHCGPIFIQSPGYVSFADARVAGLEELLRTWPSGLQGEPQSVLHELADLRQQIASHLQQPTFL